MPLLLKLALVLPLLCGLLALGQGLWGGPSWMVVAAGAASVVVLVGATIWASVDPSLGWFGETLNRVDGASGIGLTFDDGPVPGATEALLDALAAHDAHATFFLLVDRAEAHPELARRIAAEHEIGLHGLEHTPWLTLKSPTTGSAELTDARERLEQIVGRPVVLYRPPFGAVSPRLYASAAGAGLRLVWCSIRTRDGGRLTAEVLRSRCARATDGDIVLLHEGPAHTVAALPRILDAWTRRGLIPRTVGELCRSV